MSTCDTTGKWLAALPGIHPIKPNLQNLMICSHKSHPGSLFAKIHYSKQSTFIPGDLFWLSIPTIGKCNTQWEEGELLNHWKAVSLWKYVMRSVPRLSILIIYNTIMFQGNIMLLCWKKPRTTTKTVWNRLLLYEVDYVIRTTPSPIREISLGSSFN